LAGAETRAIGFALIDFNPYDHALHADPYPTYRVLRDEHPAYRNDRLGFWALSRYDDVLTALRVPSTFSSAAGITIDARGREFKPMMITMDPPDHTRLRNLVAKAFTPGRVAALEPRVRAIAAELLDNFATRGTADLVDQFAWPLPATVISELLGVPAADRASFRAWSSDLVRGAHTADIAPAQLGQAAMRAAMELYRYFGGLLAERRAAPRDDLVSALLAAEMDGRALTEDELLGFCFLLLIAGHETTANLLGNAFLALARHPDARAGLARDPGGLTTAVEEFLRYDAPVQGLARTVARDVEVHGRRLHAGDKVLLLFGSANRDERRFAEPDRLILDRRPNPHLAFGHGTHACLGALLAEMEARVGLELFLARIPDYDVVDGEVERLHSGPIRGLARLPITF
jgi:cytochrome P450